MVLLFFMAHLSKLPTYFVKGDNRRAAYYTVTARELIEAGYVEEGGGESEFKPKPNKQPEIVVEAGQDAFDDDSFKITEDQAYEYKPEPNLNTFTKQELVDFAAKNGVELDITDRKIELLNKCQEIQGNV